MALTSHEAATVERAREAPLLARVAAWAAVNSGTHNLPGLATTAGLLADAFSALPGEVALVDPEPAERVMPDGRVEPLAHGRHLTVTVRPDAPVQLLLTGHMDTVYPADHPFQDVRRAGDRLLGPGTADMKGGLALMLAALEAIEDDAARDRIGYQVMVNSDEETGSFASTRLIARLARGKHFALTYEPALPDGGLVGARSGSGNFSLVVTGRSAHAGRNPDDGRNALLAAADLALRLEAAKGPGLAVNPARIDGGGANNVVPDGAVLRVNFRPATPADATRARAHLDAAVATVAAEREVEIAVHGTFNRPPKPIEAALPLFETVRAAGGDLGLTLDWRPTGGVCDGNNIAACGVPVVDTMGAVGGAIHSPDEYLLVDSLGERAALSALTILRLAA